MNKDNKTTYALQYPPTQEWITIQGHRTKDINDEAIVSFSEKWMGEEYLTDIKVHYNSDFAGQTFRLDEGQQFKRMVQLGMEHELNKVSLSLFSDIAVVEHDKLEVK